MLVLFIILVLDVNNGLICVFGNITFSNIGKASYKVLNITYPINITVLCAATTFAPGTGGNYWADCGERFKTDYTQLEVWNNGGGTCSAVIISYIILGT